MLENYSIVIADNGCGYSGAELNRCVASALLSLSADGIRLLAEGVDSFGACLALAVVSAPKVVVVSRRAGEEQYIWETNRHGAGWMERVTRGVRLDVKLPYGNIVQQGTSAVCELEGLTHWTTTRKKTMWPLVEKLRDTYEHPISLFYDSGRSGIDDTPSGSSMLSSDDGESNGSGRWEAGTDWG